MKRRVDDTTALWEDVAAEIMIVSGKDAVKLVENLTDLPADPVSAATMCVRVNAPPSALDEVLAFSGSGLVGDAPPAVVADVGFGGGRLLWWDDFGNADPVQTAKELREIQSTAASLGGDAVLERCPTPVKQYIDAWGSQRSGMNIMRRIKQQFDPENVLNPGRFIGGL
ncbi:MAG: FAD-binding oxidoreductase [Dehalococcoidia bacterium]|nr:FAD-binding oxidoreductase [Dehalococcoidia bacterium]